jgi:hypothetical protein
LELGIEAQACIVGPSLVGDPLSGHGSRLLSAGVSASGRLRHPDSQRLGSSPRSHSKAVLIPHYREFLPTAGNNADPCRGVPDSFGSTLISIPMWVGGRWFRASNLGLPSGMCKSPFGDPRTMSQAEVGHRRTALHSHYADPGPFGEAGPAGRALLRVICGIGLRGLECPKCEVCVFASGGTRRSETATHSGRHGVPNTEKFGAVQEVLAFYSVAPNAQRKSTDLL